MKRKISASFSIFLTSAFSLVAIVALTGCSFPTPSDDQDSRSPSPTESSSSSSSSSDFSIPQDFPAIIPIISGPVVLSSSTEEGGVKTWAVEVIVDNLEDARLETLAKMQSAGFALQDEQGIGSDDYNAVWVNADYTIRCKIYLENDTGELEIRYVVISS